MNGSDNARRILATLDAQLAAPVELTLYGRAALHLGFANPPAEFALSNDVDVVLWLGQAEDLAQHTNFWEAVEATNRLLAEAGLYVSHLFDETQVILRPCWREARQPIPGDWRCLKLSRLGDLDLLLSKLMRDDPQDLRDALFIAEATRLDEAAVSGALAEARVPAIAELQEQFVICRKKFLDQWRTQQH
jgi:hypothetical protein